MLVYILKSVACLAILFVFYKVFLEKENMHVFKRFYLLGALLFSMIVPSLIFTEYVEVEPTPIRIESTPVISPPAEYSNDVIHVPPALEADILDIEPLLWGIYFIGLFFFGLKFLRNLLQIFRRIRKNPKQRVSRFTQVLLLEKITPHTFFSYIFLNKKKFEADQIPAEVLLHEETHARQKHSWDVILAELLHVIFWINPFIYLTKKAIKLNHEFLADQAVLQRNIDKSTYQNTLLSYLSPDSEKKYQPLANAINYSSIKKRFTVMKTHTSKKAVLFRTLLLLPLLSLMLYGFSETKVETIVIDPIIKMNTESEAKVKGISNRSVELAGLILDSETLVPIKNAKIYDSNGNILSKTDKRGYYKVQFDALGEGEIKFEFSLQKDGYKTLAQQEHWGNLQGKIEFTVYYGLQKEASNTKEFSELVANNQNHSYESILSNFDLVKSRFEFNKKIDKVKNGNQQVLFKIDKDYYLINDSSWIRINSKEDLISIDDRQIVSASEINGLVERKKIIGMTPLGKNRTALFAIYTIPVNSVVVPISEASKAELSEYNKLAKKYNVISVEKRSIPLNDLKILETVFRKMSSTQKSENQPFPECTPQNIQENQMAVATKFEIQVAATDVGVKMKCTKGCAWVDLAFSLRKNQSQNVDFNGMTNNLPISDNQKSNNFLFSIKKLTNGTIKMKGLKGTTWKDLTFSLSKNEFKKLNQFGIQAISSNKEATPKQVAEYNVLAKKYNTMLSKSKSIQIKMKDVERLEYIYGLMSKKQKADAEPFPDFPEPPPAPKAPKELKELKEPKAPKASKVLKGEVSDIPPPPPASLRVFKGEISNIPPPPAPPEPVSPLDHVIAMAKKGATFYYEGKKVSSDKAIELLKNNKDLNIQSTGENSNSPKVKISTKPIYLERSAKPTSIETGNIDINGKEGFYSIKNGVTSYFNSEGQNVDKNGTLLSQNSKVNPKIYFNGKQISSVKANRLLSGNRSIQVASEEYDNGNYAILLSDLNSYHNLNVNTNHNPNSVIDLTEMIAKGALFFYDDKPITPEKALWLAQNSYIERVNTMESKKGKTKVYLWKKA